MKNKLSKKYHLFIAKQEGIDIDEHIRKIHLSEVLNKKRKDIFIGCDPAIAGEDKTIECFVKRDGYKFEIPSIEADENYWKIRGSFRKEYGLNSKPVHVPSPLIKFYHEFNTKKIQESINKCVNLLKESVKLSDELKKQKAMKITEETKIKDLIPEGYEFNPESPMEYFKSSCNVTIPVKKKEVKDFKWYVEKYFEAKYHEFADGTKIVTSYTNSHEAQKIINNEFDLVSFELKIGLLKFICDDLQVDLHTMINQLKERKYSINSISVSDICPPEFLNSIFK